MLLQATLHLCEDVEQQRKERGVKKQPGHTSIEVNDEVHTFIVEDQDPQFEICAEVKKLSGLMHDAGYVLYTKFVLHNVEEEEKVFSFVSPYLRNWLLHLASSTQLLVLHSKL
jgi:hypothetical protein